MQERARVAIRLGLCGCATALAIAIAAGQSAAGGPNDGKSLAAATGHSDRPAPGDSIAVYVRPADMIAGGEGSAPTCTIDRVRITVRVAPSPPEGASETEWLGLSVAVHEPAAAEQRPGTLLFQSDSVLIPVPRQDGQGSTEWTTDVTVEGPVFIVLHRETWTGPADLAPDIRWFAAGRLDAVEYRSSDGGNTWRPCTAPAGSTGAAVVIASVTGGIPATGACCTEEGVCSDVLEDECPGSSLWLGAGTTCGDDCDNDGAADICEIALGMAEDCQPNGIPDACELVCDLDTDGDVDRDDYELFRRAFGTRLDDEAFLECADQDHSGAVGMGDYMIWLECYREYVGDGTAAPPR